MLNGAHSMKQNKWGTSFENECAINVIQEPIQAVRINLLGKSEISWTVNCFQTINDEIAYFYQKTKTKKLEHTNTGATELQRY
jgi:hypothetical protein